MDAVKPFLRILGERALPHRLSILASLVTKAPPPESLLNLGLDDRSVLEPDARS